jgi:hypothetical protein
MQVTNEKESLQVSLTPRPTALSRIYKFYNIISANNNEPIINPPPAFTPLAEFGEPLLPPGLIVFVVPAPKLVCVPADPPFEPFVGVPVKVLEEDDEVMVDTFAVASARPQTGVTTAAAVAHTSITQDTAIGISVHLVPVLLGVRSKRYLLPRLPAPHAM